MKVIFTRSFARDLRKISNKALLRRVQSAITQVEQAGNLKELSKLKKLQGYKVFYRIRVGDYRIGLKVV